jgi:pyrimidine-nucleoside phosphorylase
MCSWLSLNHPGALAPVAGTLCRIVLHHVDLTVARFSRSIQGEPTSRGPLGKKCTSFCGTLVKQGIRRWRQTHSAVKEAHGLRTVELIHKKRLGQALSEDEINFLVAGYVKGDIPDYQMSAFTMAVCFQGMTEEETAALTMAMVRSGQTVDLSGIPGVKVDKHSTGGVGDTTTLIVGPLVAAVGVPVAKMSGRGLGHTGGTLDKLESIPGFQTSLTMEAFLRQVREIGIAVAGQTGELAPADKKLYALRDVTDTVESIPLIASSIMSKKLASGADAIVLDVKVGAGAFMKDLESARTLAEAMVRIGERAGRTTVAVLTQMDQPLGNAIGNALEVREAIQTLRGQGPQDLTELCLTLGAEMVVLAGKAPDTAAARALLQDALESGKALEKFRQFIAAQGGDPRVVDDLSLLPKAPVVKVLSADRAGVVLKIHAEAVGLVAMRLGAGRATKEDVIDPAVGLVLRRKVGESVVPGEPLVEIHARSEADANNAMAALTRCIEIGDVDPFTVPLVLGVTRGATKREHSQSSLDHPQSNLLQAARDAMQRAYVPYSQFAVGAALLLSNGEIVTGANVENASYGLTNCAERTAVFRYIMSDAYRQGAKIERIAVIADSDGPVAPCGACRQVLAEFCSPDTPVELADLKGNVRQTTLRELLPYAFSAAQME